MDSVVSEFIELNSPVLHLAVAFLLGAVIGIERGWETREQKAGERIAGIRTFALVGLLGGVCALLGREVSEWMLPVGLVSLVAVTLVAFNERLGHIRNFSITSCIALILTFCYGAIAVRISPAIAAAAAVVTAIVLDNRQEIHSLVNRLMEKELDAGLKLLLISVVILPILPNKGFGPGGAINLYGIWWMVVLIAAISFVGYFAMRVAGTARGILFTSIFAGLSSSTALTLHFSRQSQRAQSLSPQFAVGILIACGTMFPRILIYCAIINHQILQLLLWPVLAMALCLYLPAIGIWVRHRHLIKTAQPPLNNNPLDLSSALLFGGMLTLILFLGEVLRSWLGDKGIYMLAATSGIVDVDAITLSLTRMSQGNLAMETAVLGIVLAASANNLVKTAMALLIGTRALGLRVAIPMALAMAVGLCVACL